MIYLQLFLSFLQIGAFSFGGGYAAMPLIQNQVVDLHNWLTVSEFTDLVTLSQMTPGPIAVNSATFVGLKIAGIPGAIISTIGCILPSCIIVTLIAYFYMKYRHLDLLQNILRNLRPAVVSLIFIAGLTIMISAFFIDSTIGLDFVKVHMIIIFILSLFLLIKKKMNPILVMVLAGILNVIYGFVI